MTTEELITEITNDFGPVDETQLASESLKTAQLIQKYSAIWLRERRVLHKMESQKARIRNVLRDYYRHKGVIDEEEAKALHLTLDGTKAQTTFTLAADIESAVESHPFWIKVKLGYGIQQDMVQVAEQYFKYSIRERSLSIRNAIDYQKHTTGQ